MKYLMIILFVLVLLSGIEMFNKIDFWPDPPPRIVEQAVDEALAELGKREAKFLGIQFLGVGGRLHIDALDSKWSTSFVDRRARTIDEGRRDAIHILEAYWEDMKRSPVFENYMDWYRKYNPDMFERDGQVHETSMGIRLAYWDENTDRREFPYLAQIRVADGDIYYYYANPKTQALEEPIRESFSEARSIIKASS